MFVRLGMRRSFRPNVINPEGVSEIIPRFYHLEINSQRLVFSRSCTVTRDEGYLKCSSLYTITYYKSTLLSKWPTVGIVKRTKYYENFARTSQSRLHKVATETRFEISGESWGKQIITRIRGRIGFSRVVPPLVAGIEKRADGRFCFSWDRAILREALNCSNCPTVLRFRFPA